MLDWGMGKGQGRRIPQLFRISRNVGDEIVVLIAIEREQSRSQPWAPKKETLDVIGLSWSWCQSDTRAAQVADRRARSCFLQDRILHRMTRIRARQEWSSTVADSPNRFNEIKPIYFRCSNDRFSITSPRTRRNITITNPIFIRTNRTNVN